MGWWICAASGAPGGVPGGASGAPGGVPGGARTNRNSKPYKYGYSKPYKFGYYPSSYAQTTSPWQSRSTAGLVSSKNGGGGGAGGGWHSTNTDTSTIKFAYDWVFAGCAGERIDATFGAPGGTGTGGGAIF